MTTLSSILNAADRAVVTEDNFEILDALVEAIAPIGGVIAWCKTLTGVPALSSSFVECNGQVLSDADSPLDGQTIPNLNASGGGTKRFLRGHTASGATGGVENHSHTDGLVNAPAALNTVDQNLDALTVQVAADTHVHTFQTSVEDHLPPYYEVVWVMRVK